MRPEVNTGGPGSRVECVPGPGLRARRARRLARGSGAGAGRRGAEGWGRRRAAPAWALRSPSPAERRHTVHVGGGRLTLPPAPTHLQSRCVSFHPSTSRVREGGPGAGSPVPVVGRKDARPLPRGGSHLSDSALPTRRARRKSLPGPRAPPGRAPPWLPRCRRRTSPSAAAAATAPTGPERRGRAATGGRPASPPRAAPGGDGSLGVRPAAPACRLGTPEIPQL